MQSSIKRTQTVTVKFSPEEMFRIDRAWKDTNHLMNRSQFVRAVVNEYTSRTKAE